MLALNLVSILVAAALTASVLGAGGWSPVDLGLMACCLLTLPWTVLGFWNAVIGFWLMRRGTAGLAAAVPFHAAGDGDAPIRLTTAIVMTLRNEDPVRALSRLERVKASLDATGPGSAFAFHVLSDTDDPAIAVAEERAVAAWRDRMAPADQHRVGYRRRPENTGFKAGNLQEFCARAVDDLMLPLDADSLMDGACILRLVRIMQAHPAIGILQSLVVGSPSGSPFARIFQFGMCQGMRPYTMGSAWWTGDCGPFWGHNAVVRIRPFAAHCRMPILGDGPLDGPILSHDQIEAVLMRRAGYEVRVLPVEGGSFEDNPPTLIEHVTRELRWCFGNMQYLRLLGLPNLHPVSRFQLVAAIVMFLTAPALTLALLLLPLKLMELEEAFPAGLAAGLYLAWLVASVAPKLAGYVDLLTRRDQRAAYGGTGIVLAGAALEIAFSFLLLSVSTFRLTVFLVRRLGRGSGSWNPQERDAHGLSFGAAAGSLWDCVAFGIVVCAAIAWSSPVALAWSLPLTLGYLVCIPFAMATASPALGRAMLHRGVCAMKEENARSRDATSASRDGRQHFSP